MFLKFLKSAIAAATLLLVPGVASAQDFPTKDVTIVVGWPPGGSTDVLARLVADELTKKWGKTVIVENRPGGEGAISASHVSAQPADGHTLLWSSGTLTIAPNMLDVGYDPRTDFKPISLLAGVPRIVVVNPKLLPVTTLQEFIDKAKAEPGSIRMSTGGLASIQSLMLQHFSNLVGIKLNLVPYQGGQATLTAVLSGEVHGSIVAPVDALEYLKSGQFTALAISSAAGLSSLPDVPSIATAAGIDYDETSWIGVLAPAGTPDEIVNKLYTDINAVMALPEMQDRLELAGWQPIASTPEEFTAFIAAEMDKWAGVMADSK